MVLTNYLTTIADAIRNKRGTTEKIKAKDFASEILKISGGSSEFECTGKKKCFIILGQSNAVGATWGDEIDNGILNSNGSLDNVHYSFNDCGGNFRDYCRYSMNGYLTHGYDTYLWKYIADALQEDIYVIKYAIGATALSCEALGDNGLLWSVDNETIDAKSISRHSYIRKLTYEAIGAIRQCIKNYGSEFEIVAILWNQGDGESSYAQYYKDELRELVNVLRSELNLDNVPFITQLITKLPNSSMTYWLDAYKTCASELNNFYWKDMRKSNLGMLSDNSHYTNDLCRWMAKVTLQRLMMIGIIPYETSNETRTILIDGKEINLNEISTKRYCLIINDSTTKPKYHIFFSDYPIYANVKVQDVSIKLNMKTYQYCYTTDDFETFTIGNDVVQTEYTQYGTIYSIEDLVYSTDNFYYTGGITEVASLDSINYEVLPLFTEYNNGIIDRSCTSLFLDKSVLSITDNNPSLLVATVIPSNTTDSIVWFSNDETIAVVNNGVITPVGTGNCTITATCGTQSATCEVTVEMQEIVTIPCTSVTLDKVELNIISEASQTLEANILPSDTTDTVTWVSDNESVAVVSNGTVTPVSNGSCNITVTCGEYSATCAVTVDISTSEDSGILQLNSDTLKGTNGTIYLSKDVAKLSTVNYSFDYEIYTKKNKTDTDVIANIRNVGLSNIKTYNRKVYDSDGNVVSETSEQTNAAYFLYDTLSNDDWYTEIGHIEGTIYAVGNYTSGSRAITYGISGGASGSYIQLSNIKFTLV